MRDIHERHLGRTPGWILSLKFPFPPSRTLPATLRRRRRRLFLSLTLPFQLALSRAFDSCVLTALSVLRFPPKPPLCQILPSIFLHAYDCRQQFIVFGVPAVSFYLSRLFYSRTLQPFPTSQ